MYYLFCNCGYDYYEGWRGQKNNSGLMPFLFDLLTSSFLELREAFEAEAQEVKKPRLLLTAAVPVGPDNVRGGYDVPAVAR